MYLIYHVNFLFYADGTTFKNWLMTSLAAAISLTDFNNDQHKILS